MLIAFSTPHVRNIQYLINEI